MPSERASRRSVCDAPESTRENILEAGRILEWLRGNNSQEAEVLRGQRKECGVIRPPDSMTDERLLKRASRGDEAAFLLLYERHRDAVFRFAYRLLGSTALAEDVAHDCFLSLIKQPERFDPSRAVQLRTYLYAAARNLAMKHFRRQGREAAADELPEEPRAPSTEEPLRRLLDAELSSEVRRAVEELSPLQREALILFEYEELSLAEIAAIVGADIGTVKARLSRARQRLRRSLAPYFRSGTQQFDVEEVVYK
ncbi:MAG: RNA polymerase sigma factor [Pyrinomonadaceae bacterium]